MDGLKAIYFFLLLRPRLICNFFGSCDLGCCALLHNLCFISLFLCSARYNFGSLKATECDIVLATEII